MMKKLMSVQEVKDSIDGYHCLVSEGMLSEGDCSDAINDCAKHLVGSDRDEAYDYVYESYCKFGLNND